MGRPDTTKAASLASPVISDLPAEASATDALVQVLQILQWWAESFEGASSLGRSARLLIARISEKGPTNQPKLVAQFAIAIAELTKGRLDPACVFSCETDALFKVLARHYGRSLLPSFCASECQCPDLVIG